MESSIVSGRSDADQGWVNEQMEGGERKKVRSEEGERDEESKKMDWLLVRSD